MEPFLFRPLTPYKITQDFGENTVCVSNTTGNIIKCDGTKPPGGYRSIYSEMLGHNGLDLKAYHKQPVFCAANGKVARIETEPERGLGVEVHSTIYLGGKLKKFKHRYWHLHSIYVRPGDRLKIGDIVGLADNTGYSTGTHLHFDLKELSQDGHIKNYNNGYYGSIDPKPYMHDQSAESVQWSRNLYRRGLISLQKLLDYLIK